MTDLISRHGTMDEISKLQTYKMFEGEDTVYLDANDVGSVIASMPSAQPYTEEEIQKMQDLEQAELDKAFELGQQDAQPELSDAYMKAVWTWLIDYQVKAAELQGRYTPYEVLGWVANDWRKEHGQSD